MWETLRNVWRVPELRKKVLYTFFMLLIFRLISAVPCPGITRDAVAATMSGKEGIFGMFNMMTGNSFSNMTIMAMGISPYINASIIMQLLTIAIPALERLSKDGGEEGKKKINRITRYLTVGLAALEAIGIIRSLGSSVVASSYRNFFGYVSIGIIMAGGTALAMWIGDKVTQNGIGNGVSLLIFVNIVTTIFTSLVQTTTGIFQGTATVGALLTIVLSIIVITVIVTYVDMAERRIPVMYAKRVVGRKQFGGQNTHIPLKVLAVGVLPIIFASSFLQFPGTIWTMVSGSSQNWWTTNMNMYSPWYMIICALLVIAFSFFYTSITFNPQDIADNIQKQGGTIPGKRPGAQTVKYLATTSNRLTLFAALFLAVLNTLPGLLTIWQQVSIPFGATSIMIAVSVGIETVRQVESQLVMRNYKGFLG